MATINISNSDGGPTHGPFALSDFAVIASYNWLNEPEPTILVPGMPAIWSPPSEAPALEPDSGTRYVDQNADRMPLSPLEPLLRAVQTHRPDFDLSELDVVCDRRPLRLLHGFIVGNQEVFQFGVEAIGNTTVFTRAERTTRIAIAPNTFAGYRASFEEAYTKLHPDAKGSTSHYRIVTYTLGGLKLLVRSGVDAYRPSAVGEHLSELSGSDYNEEDCTRSIKHSSLNEGLSTSTSSAGGELLVMEGGHGIPQAAILELSTHASGKPSVIHKKIVDLYLSQTPCFVEGYFNSTGPRYNVSAQRARFGLIREDDVTEWTKEWEKQHQGELATLVSILKQIVTGARTLGKPCIVKFDGVGDLRLGIAGDEGVPSLSEKWKEVLLGGKQRQA